MVCGGIGLRAGQGLISVRLTELTRNHCMVSLVGLQRDLLDWFKVIFS